MGLRGFFNNMYNAYQRMADGSHHYVISTSSGWGIDSNNLEMAQNHPILTPAMLFISNLFSQAKFEVFNKRTGKLVDDHPILKLLKDPNYYQTSVDFLETLMFMRVAQGYCVGYLKKVPGGVDYNSIYILNPDLIEWPMEYKSTHNSRKVLENKNLKVVYDRNGENLEIKVSDLLFFYDSPNSMQKNFFKAKSRIDGLKQTLINTHDSLLAKNIILKTNGKELITSGKGSQFGMGSEEKERIENIYQANYGLSNNRKRAIITRADVQHKSLHIALRDLGLDESVKVDGNLIYTALHIPKDILSLEAKKTTYNNFKESMVSFIQNEMQGSLDSVVAVLQKLIPETYLELRGHYNHLPVMQFVLLEKYKMIKLRGEALKQLRESGLPDEEALRLTDFETTIELNELSKNENSTESQQQQQESSED